MSTSRASIQETRPQSPGFHFFESKGPHLLIPDGSRVYGISKNMRRELKHLIDEKENIGIDNGCRNIICNPFKWWMTILLFLHRLLPSHWPSRKNVILAAVIVMRIRVILEKLHGTCQWKQPFVPWIYYLKIIRAPIQ